MSMLVECERLQLEKTLGSLVRACDGYVHMGATAEMLRITTHSDGIWLQHLLPSAGSAGDAVVDARLLHEIVRSARGDNVGISVSDGKKTVAIEGMGSRWDVPATDVDAFNPLPTLGDDIIHMTAVLPDFVAALRAVSFAACKDEIRTAINGLLLERKRAGLMLVATDMHRLAIKTMRVKDGRAFRHILPLRAAQALLRIIPRAADDIHVLCDGRRWHIDAGPWTLSAPVIDTSYPTYEKVIPKEFSCALQIDRELLLGRLHAALPVASRDANRLVMRPLKRKIKLSADSMDAGLYTADLPMVLSGGGTVDEIAFNANHMLQAATSLAGEDVVLELTHARGAARLRAVDDEEHFHILMLMQIM